MSARPQVAAQERVVDVPNLRELRRWAFLSQRDLAARAGLTQATVARLEAGKHRARPTTIRRLAAALGVEPHALVGRPPKEDPT
jgi:transcriptional regulator with XRE-family HTH domain